MIIQSRTHREYCLFKRKALLFRMTLNQAAMAAENKSIKRDPRHHLTASTCTTIFEAAAFASVNAETLHR